MPATAEIYSTFETCERKGIWGKKFARPRLDGSEALRRAIKAGLTETEREDFGIVAGEAMMDLCATRGIDTNTTNVYDSAIHHASLADILTTTARRSDGEAWLVPEPSKSGWESSCYLNPSGTALRRIVLVSSWSDERHYAECRSWYTLGEIAAYELPMQLCVFVIGSQRDGRRHSPWSKGLLHPSNRKLRFRKKSNTSTEGFKDTWARVWREEHDEIEVSTWLQAMLDDDILRDVSFVVDVAVPPQEHLNVIRKQMDSIQKRMEGISALPEVKRSPCDYPIPCQFRECCHSVPEVHPLKAGFVLLEDLDSST